MTGRNRRARILPTLFLGLSALLVAPSAYADDTINHPGDHPKYGVEIEPHVLLGWDNIYPGGSWGFGGRFSIPLVQNGFVPSINNSVAISFGVDAMIYEACWYHASCTATYLDFPVTLQWNFFVAQRWSVFGEPGLMLYHGFFNDCPPGSNCPGVPVETGVYPVIFLGGRYHLSPSTALTLRIGFPTFSFGFSFML
jgi:hypothetical protein